MSKWIVVLCAAFAATASAAERRVENGVFVSDAMPELRLRVAPRFEYLGATAFVLKNKADVERHHWVTTQDGHVTAMVVLQFEGLRDGVEGSYRFEIPEPGSQAGSNYRFAPERVRLGKHDFVHNTWAYDNGRSIRENPDAETAHTARLLEERGYTLADELIMARYVTEVGTAQRDELIVFYIEPLDRHGRSLTDFPAGGPASAVYDAVSDQVRARSMEVLRWE